MDDEPIWAADHVVTPTLGFAITILETANEFAIKGNHLTPFKGNQIDGRTKTYPHKHIHEFLRICKMFKYIDTENEAVRLMMFPLSLTGEAKTWLDEINEGTIETWLAERPFQHPIGIAENMLVKVGKFTFPVDFVILEIKEDSKVPLILGRPFLHAADGVIRVKQKQLNLGVGTERMNFSIDSAMKHSYSNNDTCFSIDVIDEILEADFDALLDERVKSFIPSRDLFLKKNSLLNSMNSWL
ncbi:reverse transcriptase domain-containing protein [Tanacetum coccineum]